MDKRFWAIILFLALGFAGFALFRGDPATTTTKTTSASSKPTQHITGKADAKVQLIEYSDFQCPACGAFYPVVGKVIAKYQDRISFTYRQYPLTTLHRNAFAASRASEAAAKQGKFWEMYNLLFQNQQAWANTTQAQTTFERFAKQIDLDMPAYKKDFASSQVNNAILASIKEFDARKLPKSTPTFLLNGKKITPNGTLEDFSRYIDKELAR